MNNSWVKKGESNPEHFSRVVLAFNGKPNYDHPILFLDDDNFYFDNTMEVIEGTLLDSITHWTYAHTVIGDPQ
jgi:hypothetical protein